MPKRLSDEEDVHGDNCPFCSKFNSPGSEVHCKHFQAWMWDSSIECTGAAQVFQSVWNEVASFLFDNENIPVVTQLLKREAHGNALLAPIMELTRRSNGFAMEFAELEFIKKGGGWATGGMLGGSGFNMYIENDKQLLAVTAAYQDFLSKARVLVA